MSRAWIDSASIKARMASLDPRGTHQTDSVKDDLAEKACQWIERECRIRVLRDPSTPLRARFNGNNRTRLHLPFAPVNSVLTLRIGEADVSVGDADAFAARTAEAYWDAISIRKPSGFPRGFSNVLVVWDAGYDYQNVPEALRSLAEAVAILMFKERDRWGDESKNLPSQTVSYSRTLPPNEALTFRGLKDRRGYFEGFGGVVL